MASRLKSNNLNKQTNNFTGIRHIEEEECQFSLNSKLVQDDDKVLLSQQEKIDNPSHFNHQEICLEVKMNLRPYPERESQREGLLKEEGQTVPTISSFNFKLNLQPYGEQFDIISSKTQNIGQYFDQPWRLIIARSDKSLVSIKQVESIKGFKMLVSYRLPCSYSQYVSISQKGTTQLSSIIAQSKQTEVIQPNLIYHYLQFKKFMLLEPRFFHYLKYTNSSDKSHWEVCVSAKTRPNPDKSLKECELLTVTCFQDQKQGLNVNSYIELDLKSNIRARKVVQRVCEEAANYFDCLWTYTKQHSTQTLA